VKWKTLSEDDETLGTWLQASNYEMAAVISNLHLTRRRNFDRGFDHYENLRVEADGLLSTDGEAATEGGKDDDDEENQLQLGNILFRIRSQMRHWPGSINPFTPALVAYRYWQLSDWATVPGKRVVDRFIDTLDELGEPFFAWTHLMDVHGPLHPDRINEAGLDWSAHRQFTADARQLSNRLTPDHHVRYDYAARYEDIQLGRIMDYLKHEGLWEDTVVVVTADHGAALFDHDFYGHPPHYPFEESLQVPPVVRIPGHDRIRTSRPFSLAWLSELLAECLDLDPPDVPAASGVDSHLSPDGERADRLVADSISPEGHTVVVYENEWKYARHYGELTHGWATVATPELADALQQDGLGYRLDTDPGEYHPVEVDDRLAASARIADEIRTTSETLPGISGGFSGDVENRLKQLGYVIE